MNNFISISVLSICCLTSAITAHAEDKQQALSAVTLYDRGDYQGAAKVIKKQVHQKENGSDRIDPDKDPMLYRERLFLAYLLAWRLNKTDEALVELAKAGTMREKNEDLSKFAPVDLLYSCDILERTQNLQESRECYERFLLIARTMQEKEYDDFSIIMLDEYAKLAKYQIDGISLSSSPQDRSKMNLKRLKLSSQAFPVVAPLLAFLASPVPLSFERPPSDVSAFIEKSTGDIGSMIMNYALVVNASASEVTEASGKALGAYLRKYPSSYYSLVLRYQFMKYYQENGLASEAKKMERELTAIGQKRGIEIVTSPDKRFTSPEETWKTYRNALMNGELEEAMECYLPGQRSHKKAFEHLGKEKGKEIAEKMGDIGKITANERQAKYRIRKMENGSEITYYIQFVNMDGEWKMQEF